jgi:hypothetical protein
MHKYTSELRADELGTNVILFECQLSLSSGDPVWRQSFTVATVATDERNCHRRKLRPNTRSCAYEITD